MANFLLLYDDLAKDATVTGSVWLDSLPVTNLQEDTLAKKARTSQLSPAPFILVDFGAPRYVQMFALLSSNLSADATIRIRVGPNSDGSSPVLDVTVTGVEANIPWGSLPWGSFPWNGIDPATVSDGAVTYYNHTEAVRGRYILVNISDGSNADTYVQAGRFMAGVPFQPAENMEWGTQLLWLDDSKTQRSLGGQLYIDERPRRRRLSVQFNFLTEAEAMGVAYQIGKDVGLGGAVLAIYDPDDSTDMLSRRAIYGSLPDLSPIVHQRPTEDAGFSWALTVEERK